MTSVASFVLLTLSSSLDDLSQYSQTHHVATDREIIPSSGLTSWIFHLTYKQENLYSFSPSSRATIPEGSLFSTSPISLLCGPSPVPLC